MADQVNRFAGSHPRLIPVRSAIWPSMTYGGDAGEGSGPLGASVWPPMASGVGAAVWPPMAASGPCPQSVGSSVWPPMAMGGGSFLRFPDRSIRGLGWQADLPDCRDATLGRVADKYRAKDDEEKVHEAFVKGVESFRKQLQSKTPKKNLERHLLDEKFFSPVEDQGPLGSCTAQAAVGLVEYLELKRKGNFVDASRLFLYKATRNLLGWTADQGAYVRSTMKALSLFGVLPEQQWPYTWENVNLEPTAYMYAYARNYTPTRYLRLDGYRDTPEQILQNVKATLLADYPTMFGFVVYESISTAPDIPFPGRDEATIGGHAILAVGYDDNHEVPGLPKDRWGALRIRNSWGSAWGDNGYGWLPYEYVLNGLATDFWTIYKQEWNP